MFLSTRPGIERTLAESGRVMDTDTLLRRSLSDKASSRTLLCEPPPLPQSEFTRELSLARLVSDRPLTTASWLPWSPESASVVWGWMVALWRSVPSSGGFVSVLLSSYWTIFRTSLRTRQCAFTYPLIHP